MTANIDEYTNLITSEHITQPDFVATVALSCQPEADLKELYSSIPTLFDVDTAIGQQLDVVGQWVGASRYLDTALDNVYFSFDIALLGFDQGVWLGPFDPITGLTRLPDEFYRLVIKARIINNHWDGTKEQAYLSIDAVLASLGYVIFIEDYSDLTMALGITYTGAPTSLTQALLISGKLNIKPIGVRIKSYFAPTNPGALFGFDINSSLISGFDSGSWATITTH
jgi:hypothetical protein